MRDWYDANRYAIFCCLLIVNQGPWTWSHSALSQDYGITNLRARQVLMIGITASIAGLMDAGNVRLLYETQSDTIHS